MTEDRLFNFARFLSFVASLLFVFPSFSDLLAAKLKAIQSRLACPKCPLTLVPGRSRCKIYFWSFDRSHSIFSSIPVVDRLLPQYEPHILPFLSADERFDLARTSASSSIRRPSSRITAHEVAQGRHDMPHGKLHSRSSRTWGPADVQAPEL